VIVNAPCDVTGDQYGDYVDEITCDTCTIASFSCIDANTISAVVNSIDNGDNVLTLLYQTSDESACASTTSALGIIAGKLGIIVSIIIAGFIIFIVMGLAVGRPQGDISLTMIVTVAFILIILGISIAAALELLGSGVC
jgi:hypothetical protein